MSSTDSTDPTNVSEGSSAARGSSTPSTATSLRRHAILADLNVLQVVTLMGTGLLVALGVVLGGRSYITTVSPDGLISSQPGAHSRRGQSRGHGENSDVDAQEGDSKVFASMSWIVQRERERAYRRYVKGKESDVHTASFLRAPRTRTFRAAGIASPTPQECETQLDFSNVLSGAFLGIISNFVLR